jgi:hypothetical protein
LSSTHSAGMALIASNNSFITIFFFCIAIGLFASQISNSRRV